MADLTTTPSGIWVLQALLGVEKMPTALRLRPFVPSIDGGGTVVDRHRRDSVATDRRVRVAGRGRGHRRTRSGRRGGAGLDGRGRPAAAGGHGRHPAAQTTRRHVRPPTANPPALVEERMMSICQRERWLAMIARSEDRGRARPAGRGRAHRRAGRVDLRHRAARVLRRTARRDLGLQPAQCGAGAAHSPAPSARTRPMVASALTRLGLSPDQVAVLSAAARLDESAMAVVTVIDHGIKPHVHPDVISVIDSELGRITISYTTGPDGTRWTSVWPTSRRRSATRPGQPAQRGEGAGSVAVAITVAANANNGTDERRLRSPNLRLGGAGPASKVLSHGFESGQRTPGVGALFLEPAKCRSAVASRCANGVRPGAAPARIADSRLHLRAARRRADVRAVLVQTRRTGRAIVDPRRPRHRRGLRPRRRPAAPGGQPDQRAADRRPGE